MACSTLLWILEQILCFSLGQVDRSLEEPVFNLVNCHFSDFSVPLAGIGHVSRCLETKCEWNGSNFHYQLRFHSEEYKWLTVRSNKRQKAIYVLYSVLPQTHLFLPILCFELMTLAALEQVKATLWFFKKSFKIIHLYRFHLPWITLSPKPSQACIRLTQISIYYSSFWSDTWKHLMETRLVSLVHLFECEINQSDWSVGTPTPTLILRFRPADSSHGGASMTLETSFRAACTFL